MNLFDYYIDVTVPLEVLRKCIRPKILICMIYYLNGLVINNYRVNLLFSLLEVYNEFFTFDRIELQLIVI